jgi:hypothetical protein
MVQLWTRQPEGIAWALQFHREQTTNNFDERFQALVTTTRETRMALVLVRVLEAYHDKPA